MASGQARLIFIYISVVLIWSTTPLAIKFAVHSLDFIQAVALRMWFSLLLCFILLKALRINMVFSAYAFYIYGSGALAICGAMMCVYFAAQILDSGLIATVWGLTPIVVSIYGYVLLPNEHLKARNLFCMVLGALGLYIAFAQDMSFGAPMNMDEGGAVLLSLAVLLLGVNLHSASSVMLKRNPKGHASLHPLVQTTGALLLSAPVYVVLWLSFAGPLPQSLSAQSIFGTLYLSIFGSVFGFIAYFYLLNHMSAAHVSLITLMTPVLALLLGSYVAHEQLSAQALLGCGVIMLALLIYQQQALISVLKKANNSGKTFFIKSVN